MKLTGTGQDRVRWPAMLVRRLSYLAGNVAVADFQPNDQQREVHQILKDRLAKVEDQFEAIISDDLPTFDGVLRKHNLTGIITGG